jgi:hypothetical protein
VAEIEDPQAELNRRFLAAVSGEELADLRRLGGDLGLVDDRLERPTRPELRRPQQKELRLLRIRVDLDDSDPPIWRRLELRSDLRLDSVHQVLQVAFGWTDSHLHRFALGGHPFDLTSQVFLCPFDVEEGEPEDAGGVAAADVRLDEALQAPGDVMTYVYDYGDSWELTLRLEGVVPAPADAPSATVLDGRRAAPPEDSGGAVDEESLAEILDDPAHFDREEVNQALRNPFFVLREYGVHDRLVELVNRLRYTAIGEDLAVRSLALLREPTRPEDDALASSLAAYTWFLDRAADGGIELTAAGYLRPVDVEAASAVVPAMSDWYGKKNREANTGPLLHFRQSLQTLGLLRKYKGRLVITRLGRSVQHEPVRLWDLLAEKMIPDDGRFEWDATLLLLAYAASSVDTEPPLDSVAAALSELGWRHRDGRPLQGYELYRLPVWDVLRNVGTPQRDRGYRWVISEPGAALARAALRCET